MSKLLFWISSFLTAYCLSQKMKLTSIMLATNLSNYPVSVSALVLRLSLNAPLYIQTALLHKIPS